MKNVKTISGPAKIYQNLKYNPLSGETVPLKSPEFKYIKNTTPHLMISDPNTFAGLTNFLSCGFFATKSHRKLIVQ
jgi:hypothetical protein